MRRPAAVLALSLMLPTAALAAPDKLEDTELDLVTAGVAARVGAAGLARGSIALTDTDARTKALGGRFASVAIGLGLASAKGSDGARTGVDVSGEGKRVRTHTDTIAFKTPKGTVSHSWGFVVAIEIRAVKPAR